MEKRFAHSRFFKGTPVPKNQKYDRVVTTCWTYEPETRILTYAATVFKKESSRDHWDRKLHKQKAEKRFSRGPVRLQLKCSKYIGELSNIAMDWYIAKNLIFKFGTHNKNSVDVRRIHGEHEVPFYFNEQYTCLKDYSDPRKERELELEREGYRFNYVRLAVFALLFYGYLKYFH